MASRFYFTSLAARPMTLSGHVFKFLVCSLSSGKAVGIYEATDPGEIAVLDDAVRARRGVSEISAEDAEKLKKKVSQTPISVSSRGSSPPHVVRIPLLPQLAVEAADGVASTGRNPDGTQRPREVLPPAPAPLPSPDSLLHIQRVNSPKPFMAAESKTKKAAARAGKAKIRVDRKAIATAA